jgi:5-deoxy-glucuronate isomerase
MSSSLHRPATGGPTPDGTVVEITPHDAGWEWTGLTVLSLPPGASRTIRSGPSELFVLPLAGGVGLAVTGAAGTADLTLTGRDSVFAAVTDFGYVGRDSEVVLTNRSASRPAEVALPSSRCTAALPPAYGPAADVPVEVRGAGSATRQVTNFGVPGVWDHAEKLVCCELLTPPGNWSSYPPHKHDRSEPCPVVNEEIYYYRIAGEDQVTPGRTGFGYHRTYTGPEHADAGLAPLDELVEVRDHDVVLVPHGYHGPCIAAPGYPMYYLNVMAGPAAGRALAFCDDPAHGWVRGTWDDTAPDPRCPMTTAAGPVPEEGTR